MYRFRLKLNLTILGLISGVLLFMGVYFAKVLEQSYMENLGDLLGKEAQMVSEVVHAPEVFTNQAALIERVGSIVQTSESRITIIDRDGEVKLDTNTDAGHMENHRNRPEFQSALSGHKGTSTRYSATLGFDMLYIAVPVKSNGQIVGAVRSAMSVENIVRTIHHMWYSLATGLFVTLVIGSLVSSQIATSITRPIEEITRVARNITQRQYESRVKLKAKDEIGQLASAINFMASSLEQQMYEISENQQRLTGVLNNMVSGVLVVTENRRIMLVNPAVEQLLGTQQSELVGKLHIEAGRNFGLSQHIDKCIDTGKKVREEVHIYYPQERILDVNIAPYINIKGQAKGVVTVLHDITEIRRLEKMRSDFVANVSHELRTPITSIKGFTETLLDGAMQDEEICRNFLQIIYDESERLFRLIVDILDLSKIEQKRVSLTQGKVDVTEVAAEIVALVQEQIHRKQHTVIVPKEPVLITTDIDCLRQILLNLVSNAVAYTPENGHIWIEVNKQVNQVDIVIRDSGIGIPEKDLSRIFERFYRVDKARSRDSGGTGLGLAIVKHLCELLQGRISVQSVEGEGTTFMVTLPVTYQGHFS